MPEIVRPQRVAAIGRDVPARIVEPPRPQWQGLFVEPVLPPYDEDDD